MTELKCPVAGCEAKSFAVSSQPIPDKFKGTPLAAGLKPLRLLHCSNGHVISVDYSERLAEIERQIDLLVKKPK